ncbi:MAG: FMN-binding protein [Spirochaetia bacterium]|nr:FMN-binding protein [Spirochaetia bacterium]
MKKIFFLFLLVTTALSLQAQVSLGSVKDGYYFAQEDKFAADGWKSQAVLKVSGGKIVEAAWNGVSTNPASRDKLAQAAAGRYGMVKASKIKAEWDAQAKAAAAYLVSTQDANFAKYGKDGKTDAISGATMAVAEFYDLVRKALAGQPVAKGPYKDGWYYAEQPSFDSSGWKETVLVTVVNGSVVDLVWNGVSNKAGTKSKIVESTTGKYKMGAKNGEWHVQSARLSAAIVAAGDPAKIAVKKDGKADAVSGVSIYANAVGLSLEALKAAK